MPLENPTLAELELKEDFIHRHIGPSDADIDEMLRDLGMDSLNDLIDKAAPKKILTSEPPLADERPHSETETLHRIRDIASRNRIFKSFIGAGYYGCITPPVILRNILENPAWYTAYTPYQAEISQGRLEGLLNYQTMVTDLTGMEIANASLLDEGTAAAEAMAMCFALQRKNRKKKDCNLFWVMDDVHPQTLEVLETRAKPLGIELATGPLASFPPEQPVFGALLQYPAGRGSVRDLTPTIERIHQQDALAVVAADLLSLTLLKPPGEMGADVAVGSAQRFGVPMGFGGPHAAYFATREAHKRAMPGRIVGVSVDRHGNPGYRLALQTREQHIRREKATSNICTSQVLLAVMAGMYAVYHGPHRLRAIATRVHRRAAILAAGLERLGHRLLHGDFFDTLHIEPVGLDLETVRRRALEARFNLRYFDDGTVGVSCDETTERADIAALWGVFAVDGKNGLDVDAIDRETAVRFPAELARQTPYLTNVVFNHRHSETGMLRYLHHLASKDLSLAHAMIPLGSCTMKLNGTAEMIPITWPELANIHPFAPVDQCEGYAELIAELEAMLRDITGYPGVSLQPNAGSQGEYSGLLSIRRFHEGRGEGERNICLIPGSAHGTNPASAVMAGMRVVVVSCDNEGNIDMADLAAKIEAHRDRLGALMITYPSTHGVFEETIRDICDAVHHAGGLVYMDGANMNALVGLAKPGEFGPDVIHLNLHKTFCIPHGGGGPGVGPICVTEELSPYLPGHRARPDAFPEDSPTAVAAAPWGSASILPISWAYIKLMGGRGLLKATQTAILNANYVAQRLKDHYPVLYKGRNGLIAHECIVDLRPLKASAGVEVEDVAKRLMDFGFHAPTMSWPVAGTLMIEPTESESKSELDRFCEAMISIREEIRAIEEGRMDRENNPLKNAPHTALALTEEWDRPYSREQAVFPLPWLRHTKFWPAVGRIDNVYGDKNLVCACLPIEAYAS